MALVLDTSALISLEKEDAEIIRKIEGLSKDYEPPVFVTFISIFEFLIGLRSISSSSSSQKTAARNFLNQFSVLNTTDETAEIMANLKSKYDKKGLAMSLADLIIASLAIENKMVLVTRDKDFEKIEELKIETIEF